MAPDLSDLDTSIEILDRLIRHSREVNPMPTACAADLRAELLARVWGPTRRAAFRQDAELAELEALEAAGALASPPSPDELDGPVPDLECGPPSGDGEWLADLPAELLDEYI